jgi:hypothetical protein
MTGAPALPPNTIQDSFVWLVGHSIVPGAYQDPIQLVSINLKDFLADARTVESGHMIPLDRDGRHVPENSFLILHSSNSLQGNRTLDELLTLMKQIVLGHEQKASAKSNSK